jgi:type IV pilus assembly protein PilC
MPSYHVQFADADGQRSEIALNAPSLPALVQRLQADACTPVRVVPRRPDPTLRNYWRKISEAEVTTFLRQLAGMLDNGVPLSTALGLVARETHNWTLRAVLLDLEKGVREGDSFSAVLSAYPVLFSPVYVRLLEAGEASSRLPEVLRQLADYAERSGLAWQRIRTSLVYPQTVGIISLILMAFVFLFIAPKFMDLFRELGVKEFPFVTQTLFWFSAVFLPLVTLILPAVLLIGGTLYWRARRRGGFGLARLQARLPVIGVMYQNFALLRLTRLLAALLRSGVPLLEALRLAGQGAESPLLQAAMWDAIPHVAAGEGLATAFGHAGILPPTFCGQIAAAETSGDLPDALGRLADWYADRVDYLAARVGAMIEPFIIVILAALVGWVTLGVFAPLVAIIHSLSGGGS